MTLLLVGCSVLRNIPFSLDVGSWREQHDVHMAWTSHPASVEYRSFKYWINN